MWPLGKTEWLLTTLTSMEECGQTKVTIGKEPKRCHNSGMRSIKEHSITWRLPHKWSWPIQTIWIVFESYTNAANNWPGAVITPDNCQTRLLRPLIWNSLLCTAVQCYITINTGATCRKGQSIPQQVQANCITQLEVSDYTVQLQCHQLELLAIVETYLKFKWILRGQPTSAYWPQTKKSHTRCSKHNC